MFGINYKKFDSMTYVIHYVNGKVKKEGRGLSFFYFSPNSTIAAIPLGSNDIPFIFNETTVDYQTIVIQGQLTYKISDPKKLAELLDFNLDDRGRVNEEDSEKLKQRLINEAHTATSAFVQSMPLKEVLKSAKVIEEKIIDGLRNSKAVVSLGVEPLSVNILGIKPTPEMARALEAATRELLQQEADQAIYERRNFAVEQERRIKESELNTEIAVEEKRKQITEKQMEREVLAEENNRKLREMRIEADIVVEEHKNKLLDMQVENERKEADSKKYLLESSLTPYKQMDWKTIMAIGNNGNDPKLNIALAFRELAENADKIGSLNITPDLLESLTGKNENKRK